MSGLNAPRTQWKGAAASITEEIVARFWSKVDTSGGPDACWPWKFGRDRDGYGKFQFGPRDGQVFFRAHRFALEVSSGETGVAVLHSCDNPPCCNPKHLSWGTNLDNVMDKVAKGRALRGGAHPTAKLSDQDLLRVAELHRDGTASAVIAAQYGVDPKTIWSIVTGRYPRLRAARGEMDAATRPIGSHDSPEACR